MNLGLAIKQLRKKKGIKQYELAFAAGVSQTCASQIEAGQKYPKADTILKICSVLDIPVSSLYLLATEDSDIPDRYKKHYGHLLTINEAIIDTFINQ